METGAPLYLKVWITGPPPTPPLISRSGSDTVLLFIVAVYIVIRLISVFVRLAGGNQNEEEDLEQERVTVVVYPFTEKSPLESKWNAAFWVIPAENFWEQWNI